MALEDIVYPEDDSDGFDVEIIQGSLGTITDIVQNNDLIEELILTGGAGETSTTF